MQSAENSSNVNRRITLATRPRGEPVPSDFETVETPIPSPRDNQVLLRTMYLSLDPYMRGLMNETTAENYVVSKARTLGLPADKNEEGGVDFAGTHLLGLFQGPEPGHPGDR